MGKDEKKSSSKFHRNQTNVSRFKIGGTNFLGPVHGGKGGEFFEFLENSKKTNMERDEKKTHSRFHCDQTNVNWFEIGVTNFGSPVRDGERGEFLKNFKKHQWRTRRRIASFIVIR